MIDIFFSIANSIIPFLVVLTLLVFVHELGHYGFARYYNVHVETFSIGFGKEIYGWTDKKGTRWKISLIPLGGYVKMFGAFFGNKEEAPHYTPEEKKRALDFKPLYQRSLIVFGGPFANFLFAMLLFIGINFFVGEKHIDPIIDFHDQVNEPSNIPLKTGDHIIKINGNPIKNFQEIFVQLDSPDVPFFDLEIIRNNHVINLTIGAAQLNLEQLPIQPFIAPIISDIISDSPAAFHHLEKGDIIKKIDNISVHTFAQAAHIISNNPEKKLSFLIERKGKNIIIPILLGTQTNPNFTEGGYLPEHIGYLGVRPLTHIEFHALSFLESITHAISQTSDMIVRTLHGVGQMIIGKRSTNELGGPIRIAQISSQVAEVGLSSLVFFMAILSINLGLINLFPIPILDGGHLLFYAFEAILRRPLNEKIVGLLMNIGLLMIISLFIFTTFLDIMRLEAIGAFFQNILK